MKVINDLENLKRLRFNLIYIKSFAKLFFLPLILLVQLYSVLQFLDVILTQSH